jgi:hypothetical protein
MRILSGKRGIQRMQRCMHREDWSITGGAIKVLRRQNAVNVFQCIIDKFNKVGLYTE